MTKRNRPVTVFTASAKEALDLARENADSRALCTGPGTLNFHKLIAEHGAGVFTTLYVPLEIKPLFALPAGGEVRSTQTAFKLGNFVMENER